MDEQERAWWTDRDKASKELKETDIVFVRRFAAAFLCIESSVSSQESGVFVGNESSIAGAAIHSNMAFENVRPWCKCQVAGVAFDPRTKMCQPVLPHGVRLDI